MPQRNIHEKAADIMQPTLIVHGDKDKTVLLQQSIDTQDAMSDCTLITLSGVDHYFKNPGEHELVLDYFVSFFIQHLCVPSSS